MTDIKPRKLTYRPSSAAFQWGGITISPSSSGCLRNVLFSSHGLRDEIPAEFAEVGKAYEDLYAGHLSGDVKREVPIKQPVFGSLQVDYSGRIDFIVNNVPHECKATTSKNTRREVIRKGKPKLNHVAQLVSYMIHLEVTEGVLAVGFFERDENEKFVLSEEKIFTISIDEDGKILVDGQPSGYRVQDQLAHMQAARGVLEQQSLAPRPDGWQQKWTSPCSFCPFKAACDKLDTLDPNEAKEQQIEIAREALEERKK